MNVVAASLVEPLQIPHNYYWKKSQIKKNPKCVYASSSSGSVGSLVIETNQDQQISTSTETPTTTLSSIAARRLILLRHAKSSWENRSIRDHDRPLSRSGQLDAIKVTQNLLKLGWIPQLILSSDALRTRETLKIMQEQVQAFLEAEVHFISSFYSVAAMDGQTAEHLRQAICKYSRDEILTVIVVRQLWNLFTSFRGIAWIMPGKPSQAIESWNYEGNGCTDKNRWRIVPAVIWWTIWKERNLRCFENISNPLHRVKMNCIMTFCYWCSSEYANDPVVVVDILGSL